MLLNILYAILIILLLTTVYVVVRTILFQRGQGLVKPFTAVPVDEAEIAQHLATAVRCPTAPLDDTGTPDPEAFRQLHQMLAQTYPLVHQQLEREVVNGYSLLYTWHGRDPKLEPIMLMEIECPEQFQGSVVGNISSRRGMIVSTDMLEGKVSKIIAEVPLAETFGYSTDIRSMTQGQGTFTMELSGYKPVPASLQTEIVAERKAEQELVGAR